MSEKFKVTYGIDDGYVGGDRPHHLTIDEGNVDECDDESSLKEIFWEAIQSHFEQNVHPYSSQEAEFISWAKDRQAAMRLQSEE